MTTTRLRVGAAVLLGAGLLATSPVAAADPALQVESPTGVAVGRSVTVTLDGLPANLPMVAVGQCKPLVKAPTDCNLPTALMGSADAAGVWKSNGGSTSITLAADVGGVDCTSAAGACAIAVTSLTDPTAILAAVPLTFGSPEPAPVTEAAPAAEDDSDYTMVIVGVVTVAVLAGLVLLAVRRRARAE
ncbi:MULTISPECIES: neocarzinostatin apoprotein domain-containing protein [Nocardia]|uniref:neocarzinostatin apoprotein domain-containing protein n=1 Tax=Nocardia TaxID=1817 RepID=UPI000D69F2E5|nr:MULTISPECIES: neocarzinostatin apoprotein domain-containing protein [Nocardia]